MLYNYLLTKEVRVTVSSIEVNDTQVPMQLDEGKKVRVLDVPGHYHFKEQLLASLEDAKAIILLVDSKDKDKYPEAAEILYEILNNIVVIGDHVSIMVACNKQDLQFAKKAVNIESELEKEIEELRRVRRATQDEHSKLGYLESQTGKGKFTFNDIMKEANIQFVECSVKQEQVSDI